jgi:hypothetical protein
MDVFTNTQVLKGGCGLNVILNDNELTAKIAAANGSMSEVISRVKRLARLKLSASTPKPNVVLNDTIQKARH